MVPYIKINMSTLFSKKIKNVFLIVETIENKPLLYIIWFDIFLIVQIILSVVEGTKNFYFRFIFL